MAFEVSLKRIGDLRIVMIPDPGKESVLVSALVGAGSREEDSKKGGVAHFLEHFILKGTVKYPGMFGIKESVEEVGGAFNAFTGHDQMGFWVKMGKKHLPRAVDLVGQMVGEPQLPEKFLEKERGTILQELYMYEDDPESKIHEAAWSNFFGDTGLGRPIVGTVESLKNMNRFDIEDYFNTWFDSSNIILGVVGDFDEGSLISMIKTSFAAVLERKRTLPKRDVFVSSKIPQGQALLVKRKVEQAHVAWVFPGVKLGLEMRYESALLNIILGGSWGSRLMREVREKKGWAYSIGSGLEKFVDTGAFIVEAGLPHERLKDAVGLTNEIIFGLVDPRSKWRITEKDLKKAQDYYLGRIGLYFDEPEKVLSLALSGLMFEGKIFGIDEIRKGVNGVSLDGLYKLAKRVFDRKKMGMAVLGNYDKMDL